jgi:hypothetical protein
VLGTGWTGAVALAAAFGIALLATPAGISGAVLLLPFQVSVLGTPSPAAAVGCVGGIYGIGGGSILAPVLIGTGRPPSEVAPAALASTFVTSVAGVVTFTALYLPLVLFALGAVLAAVAPRRSRLQPS